MIVAHEIAGSNPARQPSTGDTKVKCKWCQKDFTPDPPTAVYCSQACYERDVHPENFAMG